MMFAIITLSVILFLDFLMWVTSERLDRIEEVPEMPPATYKAPEENKDFETTLKEYESETETITWEVTNKQSDF